MAKQGKKCGPEEFVRIWQTSKTFDEVVRRTGLNRKAASSRRTIYRKRGVPLKPFTGGRAPLDVKALTKLAESLANGQQAKGGGG